MTGSDKNTIFSSTDDIKWRVLSVNKDTGDVYGHGKGAIGGRSINVNDINEITGYTVSDAETIKRMT